MSKSTMLSAAASTQSATGRNLRHVRREREFTACDRRDCEILRERGMDNLAIAQQLGMNTRRVMELVGPTPAGVGQGFDALRDKRAAEKAALRKNCLAMRNQGYGNQYIAQALGVSRTLVYQLIGGAVNSKYGKISAQKDEMEAMRSRGLTNIQIARALGTTYSTVLRILGKQPAWLTLASQDIAAKKRELNRVRILRALEFRENTPASQRNQPAKSKSQSRLDATRDALQDIGRKIQSLAATLD